MHPLLLVYGKIIVDNIRLRTGEVAPSNLGGGGPQAAFGARLWHRPIALLTRSGTDIAPVYEQMLEALDLDLSGWVRYADLPTPWTMLEYDDGEQMQDNGLQISRADWFSLLDRPLALSPQHQHAAGIHLVTEFGHAAMELTALELGRNGALISLEPIFADHSCPDRNALLDLCRQVDLVTPDWPAATMMAGSDDREQVLRFWSTLGPKAIAIRHGAHGSYVWDRDHNQFWHIPPLPVEVIDPTGAGNAYGGGWFAGWQRTGDARRAGCYATVAAALMLSNPGMPDLNAATRLRAAELLEVALAGATKLKVKR